MKTKHGQEQLGVTSNVALLPVCPEGKFYVDWFEEFAHRLKEGCYEVDKAFIEVVNFLSKI